MLRGAEPRERSQSAVRAGVGPEPESPEIPSATCLLNMPDSDVWQPKVHGTPSTREPEAEANHAVSDTMRPWIDEPSAYET